MRTVNGTTMIPKENGNVKNEASTGHLTGSSAKGVKASTLSSTTLLHCDNDST
jgi:hypothetical protein